MDPSIYGGRRKRFLAAIQDGIALFHNPPESIRTHDIQYRYRPDSDCYYLTGFEEPQASCLLTPQKMVLFVRSRDPDQEVWTGRRAGVEGAIRDFSADEAYTIDRFDEILLRHLERTERLYCSPGLDTAWNERVLALFRQSQSSRPRSGFGPTALMDAGEIVHEMRLFKSPEEVKILRRAASIACQAHLEAMKRARPGAREYQIEALLEYVFRSHGSIGPAYPSIVASGPNATILHYQANQSWLREGDLILVDAGAEYGYYASDVTRTYPVSGRFSAVQRDLYALVLKAQREAIALVLPGQAWDAPHKQALHVLTEGLVRLGVLKGEVDALVAEGAFRPFYMHRTSHWLGMDVHDVGNYRIGDHARILEPGMVLTVEPGLYFSPEASGIDPVYRGIGIRIEDDILVTSEGHEILSVDAPREIEELERVVGAT